MSAGKVPNRVNYILWIQDVMRAHTDVPNTQTTPVRGIDMYAFSFCSYRVLGVTPMRHVMLLRSGTGATAIYAFLACKMDSSWSMVATGTFFLQEAEYLLYYSQR